MFVLKWNLVPLLNNIDLWCMYSEKSYLALIFVYTIQIQYGGANGFVHEKIIHTHNIPIQFRCTVYRVPYIQ